MPKPTPNCIRFSLGEGYMAVEGDYLVFAGTQHQGSSDAQCIVIEDPAQTAAVLLELAKTVLEKADEPSRRTVLLEAGLLEANSLRGSSNDLKSLKVSEVEVTTTKGEEPKVKLTTTTTKLLEEAGYPTDLIRYLGTKGWYVKILNSSANPVKAAKTMMAKPKFEGQYQGWLKNNSAPAPAPTSEDICPACLNTLDVCPCSNQSVCPVCHNEYPCPCPEPDGESFKVEDVSVGEMDGLE